MGEALRRSAAALSAAGNDINQAIGLATAGNTVIQDPDVVGTTLKTVSMYLRAAKTDAEAAGIETDGMVHSVAKLQEDIKTLAGVDIMIDETTFKSTYEILDEISQKWDEIADVDKSNLLNIMGGKRNANILSSIIENFDEARAAVEMAEKSAGSATEENQKYLESIEGHLNNLKIAYEEFSQDFINSDLIKYAVTSLTNIVKLIDDLVKGLGGLQGVVIPIIANNLFNAKNWGFSTAMADGAQRLTLLGKTIGYAKSDFYNLRRSIVDTSKSVDGLVGSFRGLPQAIGTTFADRVKTRFGLYSGSDATKDINLIKSYAAALQGTDGSKAGVTSLYNDWRKNPELFKNSSREIRNCAKELSRMTVAGASISEVNGRVEQFAEAQQNLAKQSSFATVALRSLANVALNVGAMLVINAIVQGVAHLVQARKEAEEQAQKAAQQFKETYEQTDEYINKIVALKAELESSSTTEARSKAVKEELLEIQKQLNETYGESVKNLDILTDSTEEYIKKIREANREQYAEQDYDKFSFGTNETISKFNNSRLVLDSRSYRNAGWDYYGDDVERNLSRIYKDVGFSMTFGNGGSQSGYDLSGDIFTIDKKLQEAQDKIKEYLKDDTLTDSVRKHYQKAFDYLGQVRTDFVDDVIDNGQDAFEAWVLNSDLAISPIEDAATGIKKTYGDLYYDLTIAQANYNAAVENGNEEQIKEYRDAFREMYESYISQMEESGQDPAVVSFFRNTFEEIVNGLTSASTAGDGVTNRLLNNFNRLINAADDLKEAFNTAFSNQSTLQSAYDKIIAGTSLTSDEVIKLTDLCKENFPEITTLFSKTADGFTIKAGYLQKALSAINSGTEDDLKNQIAQYRDLLKEQQNIDKYQNNIDEALSMPSSARKAAKEARPGLTEEQIKKTEEQISLLEFQLSLLEGLTKQTTKYEDSVKSLSTSVSTGVSAQKEMDSNGRLSLSTYSSLLALGEDYTKCITIENGIIKFNAEEYKNVVKAKLEDVVATKRLEHADKSLQLTLESQKGALADQEKIEKLKSDLKDIEANIADTLNTLYNNLELDWNTGIETAKDAFQETMKMTEHLHTMGLISDEQYYSALEAANEEYYANSIEHESEYLSNVEKIYSGRQQVHKKNADKEFEDLEKAYSRGFYSAEEYAKKFKELTELSYGKGSVFYGSQFAEDEYKSKMKEYEGFIDDIYNDRLDTIKRSNTGTLAAEKKFVSDWIALNEQMYKAIDPKKYRENLEEILGYITDLDDIVEAHLDEWSRKNNYNENDVESRRAYLTERVNSYNVFNGEAAQIISNLSDIESAANDATKALTEFNETFVKEYQLGNVDLAKRPMVDMGDGDIETVWSSGEFVRSANGDYVYVHFTPILPDGTILSDDAITDYLENTLDGAEDILNADKSGRSIVLKVDTDLSLTDEDIKALENGGWTDHLESLVTGFDEWDVSLHNASETWLGLTENVRSANAELATAQQYVNAFNSQTLETAKYDADTLKLQYEQGGFESYEEYAKAVRGLGDAYKAADGSLLLTESFFNDYISASEGYEAWLEDEKKATDGSIEEQDKLLDNTHKKLMELKDGTSELGRMTVTEFRQAYEEYADSYVENINKLLDKGLIDPDTAKSKIRNFYDQSILDGANLGDSWLSEALDFDGYEYALDKLQKANDKTIDSEEKFIDDWISLIKSTYGDKESAYYNLLKYDEEYKKAADTFVKDINSQVEKGIISPETARSMIQGFYDSAFADGVDLGKDWLADALNIDGYEYELEELRKQNDKTYESEKDFVSKWKALNSSTYGDKDSPFYDPAKYKANIKTIADYELEALEDAFKKGEISAEEYAKSVQNALKESDILGADYIADKLDEANKLRASQEKTYWEQQKDLVEGYYDAEIQQLQKIKNEREKIAKAEKLQLDLIKARIELENAKQQRNQLIFSNGVFYYDYDQEDVASKAQAVADAEDAIVAAKLDDEITELQEQKENAVKFYDDIISLIDAYISETVQITGSDSEILKIIENSEYGKGWKAMHDGTVKPAQLTEEQKNATVLTSSETKKADEAITTASASAPSTEEETKKKWNDYIMQPIQTLADSVKNLITLCGGNLSTLVLGGTSGTSAQDIAYSGAENVYSQSNVTNDSSVNIGEIQMTVQGGTSQEMLDQFAANLGAAIRSKVQASTYG